MIESLLDYRGNVQFFDEELIPPKQDIIDIPDDAYYDQDDLQHILEYTFDKMK